MKMNLDEIIKNYSKAKSPESLQKDLDSISNFEKDLNNIDPNYKDNLFDKLLNSNKNAKSENKQNLNHKDFSGMDLKDAISQMVSLRCNNN
jgi:hypothetical protein